MIESFVRSLPKDFVIGIGVTGVAVAAVDLGAPYKTILVECADATGVDAGTNIGAFVGYDKGGTLVELYETNDPGTAWAKGAIPATGTFGFAITHALGVWRVRLILSQVSTAAVTLTIRGLERGI